jgi:hypothetical protein
MRRVQVRRSYPCGCFVAKAEARNLAEAEAHLARTEDNLLAFGKSEQSAAAFQTEAIAARLLLDWFKTGQRPTESSGMEWTHCEEQDNG